jgi:hypothetical protein
LKFSGNPKRQYCRALRFGIGSTLSKAVSWRFRRAQPVLALMSPDDREFGLAMNQCSFFARNRWQKPLKISLQMAVDG